MVGEILQALVQTEEDIVPLSLRMAAPSHSAWH